MTGPSILACAMGVGCLLAAFLIARAALVRRGNHRRAMDHGRLTYWERVQAQEGMTNAVGDLLVAGFAVAMGLLLVGMGVSGILL